MNEIERAIETLYREIEQIQMVLFECEKNNRTNTVYYRLQKDKIEDLRLAIQALQEKFQKEENIGETSDGYHTFNELYHHRAGLFSVICNNNKHIAWKSRKHDDGTMYDNMFIVGINTPQGQATYHYDIIPYWDMFDVQELSNAPMWDGHTPAQALDRILSINENKALTLEELENMIGEPVWTLDEGYFIIGEVSKYVDTNEDCVEIKDTGYYLAIDENVFYKYKPKNT